LRGRVGYGNKSTSRRPYLLGLNWKGISMDIDFLLSSFLLSSNNVSKDLISANEPQIWIITGPRSAGKTTLCNNIVNTCRKNDLQVAGVLSHAQIEGRNKTGIILENLKNSEQRLLGSKDKIPGSSIKVGVWNFSQDTVSWGNNCLELAANEDVVIFDECGFLELFDNNGFVAGLRLFDNRKFKFGIIVIRPELLILAKKRWPSAHVHTVEGVSG